MKSERCFRKPKKLTTSESVESQIFDQQFPEEVSTNSKLNESEVKYFRKTPYQKLKEENNYSNEDSDDDLSHRSSWSEIDHDN